MSQLFCFMVLWFYYLVLLFFVSGNSLLTQVWILLSRLLLIEGLYRLSHIDVAHLFMFYVMF